MFKKRDKYELAFTIVYFIEQIALIGIYFKSSIDTNLIISAFPIIFLSTIAIEKICLKSHFETEKEEQAKKYETQASKSKIFKFKV